MLTLCQILIHTKSPVHPILQIRKLKHRLVRQPAPCLLVHTRQSPDSVPAHMWIPSRTASCSRLCPASGSACLFPSEISVLFTCTAFSCGQTEPACVNPHLGISTQGWGGCKGLGQGPAATFCPLESQEEEMGHCLTYSLEGPSLSLTHFPTLAYSLQPLIFFLRTGIPICRGWGRRLVFMPGFAMTYRITLKQPTRPSIGELASRQC